MSMPALFEVDLDTRASVTRRTLALSVTQYYLIRGLGDYDDRVSRSSFQLRLGARASLLARTYSMTIS